MNDETPTPPGSDEPTASEGASASEVPAADDGEGPGADGDAGAGEAGVPAAAGLDEFRASVEDARRTVTAFLTADRAIKLRFAGDLVALVPLVAMLLWMSTHDGGREPYFLHLASIVVLVTSPVAVAEARHLPRLARLLLGVYAVGLVLALAFAGDRNEWVSTTVIMTIVPLCGLAAHRIGRRPWGPMVLLGLLGAAFTAYFYRSFLAWWGDTMRGRVPLWRPLSWHNQSAMLMGAFGVLGLGLAGVGRRYVSGIGIVLAGGGLAGAWLSGSRGALVATVLGVVVSLVGTLRARGARQLGPVAAGAVLAVALVAGLNGMIQTGATIEDPGQVFEGGSTNPLANRTRSASVNFEARVRHMDAAIGMFLDDPLTGEGPGSYRRLALEHTSPDANLTASAHNEYLEVLAEDGLVTGLGFIGLHVLFLWAASSAVWRRREIGEDEIAGPLQVGMAAMIVAIGAHVAVDFDWTFPVLPVLLVIAAAALSARFGSDPAGSAETTEPAGAADAPATTEAAGTADATATTEAAGTADARATTEAAGTADATATTETTETADPRWGWLVALPLALLLAAAVWGAVEERAVAEGAEDLTAQEFADLPLPWQGDRLSRHALDLSRRGEDELAAGVIQEASRWGPDVRNYRAVAQIVLYRAGAISGETMVSRAEQIEPGFGTLNLIGEALIDEGDVALARALTEDLLATYDAYEAQGIDGVRAETWYLRAELEAAGGDCDEARAQIDRSVELGHIPQRAVTREYGPLVLICPGIVEGVQITSG